MFGDVNVQSVTFDLATDPGGDLVVPIFRAARNLTVVRFGVQTNQTENAGTGIACRLLNYGTAGTAAVGTVSAILGGTATSARLTANVPQSTASMVTPLVTEGQFVAISLDEQGAGWLSGEYRRFQIDYVIGQYGVASS